MPPLRQIADAKVLFAYGTSDGAAKGWDTRGRGRKKLQSNPSDHSSEKPGKEASAHSLRKQYDALGNRLQKVTTKLREPTEVEHTWAKFMHFVKALSEWHQAWGELRNFVIEVGVGVWLLRQATPAAASTVQNALHWGYQHIAPAVHALGSSLHGSQDIEFKAGSVNIRAMMDGKTFMAYGTSEGVSKEWDTRGRGRKQRDSEAWNIAKGMNRELAKARKHGIKTGDRVKNRYGETAKVAAVDGNTLTVVPDEGSTISYWHSSKVSKI